MFSFPVAGVLWLTFVSVALGAEPPLTRSMSRPVPDTRSTPSCNAFGVDVEDLTIEVKYETETRLHVSIFDTVNSETVVARPQASGSKTAAKSDLVFNYDPNPFAFWITRRSAPHSTPLFDTHPSVELDGFPLVFENQYIQVPRDIQDPINENMQVPSPLIPPRYGLHPIYMDHRFNSTTDTSQSHGVFLLNANGADILLLTPPSSNVSLIEYRLLGGTLDLYFLSGPTPLAVMQQYAEVVGTPTWQPYWGVGFHLCRWGYTSLNETRDVVARMRAAEIPLEVMWNDIDLYHAFRDFTTDPEKFPADEMRDFIMELRENNQYFIPIVDAAIGKTTNNTDFYDPYLKGAQLDVFIKNPDGTEYIGQVWPGYTVFPDWFAPQTLGWWTEALKNWSASGIEFSGIWLDMNEASSFCDGSWFVLLTGRSGGTGIDISNNSSPLSRRGVGAGNQTGVDLNMPPYATHNGFGRLSNHTLAPNASHAGGYAELDGHNLWALKAVLPGQRPFIISRSAFASSRRMVGWLGDNYSKWEYMYLSIQGILQHQMFQIPFVGTDTCGFQGNTDEELCNRWMQLSAFAPFYRNHNQRGAMSQEPYVWDSVAKASRTAIAVRYAMLPYWYSLFANASIHGTPPVRALFWEFPDEPELFSIDRQFMIGKDILVTPVLTPNVSSVGGIFPGRRKTVWRDWYTPRRIERDCAREYHVSCPLGHINVHVRDGAAILLHQTPAYTVEETRQGPFSLLVTQSMDGHAFGTTYLDDGVSDPPGPSTTVTVRSSKSTVMISAEGAFHITQKLAEVTILGVMHKPNEVFVGDKRKAFNYAGPQQKLVISKLALDLNGHTTIEWK
ncbi:glycosyl hydrolases family 31-domain-containing protein [Mycena albidolilacea]|uniref:Glycosyl hydrolases family 31-domain-containing protein n=1 Tax=Mycena albidolilacea TaxID=1033008 RepID=A0AAD6Z8J8_9AGAR|nr:glycosyl hydrolases family 31-domain-containing protein [Mycena albidolilacea]